MERRKNVEEIKRLLQKKKDSSEAFQTLSRYLMLKGISRSLAEELALEFEENELSNLLEKIAKKIHVSSDQSNSRMVALVGPTGVGKTTTIIKMAKYYLKEGKKLSILSLDQEKPFVLQSIYNQLDEKVPVFEKIEKPENFDLILVDTEGCNFYEPNRVERVGEKLASLEENVEILVTLSAASKEVDLYGAIHQFSSLSPKGLVFTKLDETLQPGVMVNLCQKTNFPIYYIAFGYPLPGEVQIADSQSIARKILTDFNRDEFQFLRHLTLE